VNIGGVRTSQVFARIGHLYGPPVEILAGGVDPAILRDPGIAPDQEIEVARLFVPH
jgi:hypothetical protein